jgi:alpha-ribazole phosphatase
MRARKLTIYGIRHTPVTLKNCCYGHSDVPFEAITADALAALKQSIPCDAVVYASPLPRCADLARQLFPTTTIHFDDRLKELHFGDWENTPWDRIARVQIDAWAQQPLTFAAPNGESFQHLIARVAEWKNSLFDGASTPSLKDSHRTLVLITHAGVMRALAVLLRGLSVDAALSLDIPHAQLIGMTTPDNPIGSLAL